MVSEETTVCHSRKRKLLSVLSRQWVLFQKPTAIEALTAFLGRGADIGLEETGNKQASPYHRASPRLDFQYGDWTTFQTT